MNAIITLALKDLLQLWRNKFGLFWVVLFPLLMALFFGAIFSGGENQSYKIKTAFIANESPDALSFLADLQKSEGLSIRVMPLDSARWLVAHGKLTAYIEYHASTGGASGFMSGGKDSIHVGIDPSRRADRAYLQGIISQVYFTRMQKQMMDPSAMRPQIAQALRDIDSDTGMPLRQRELLRNFVVGLDTFMASIDTADSAGSSAIPAEANPFGSINLQFSEVAATRIGPRNSWEITFPQSLLWALIGCAATFALSLVMERTRGTYLRLRLAPISRLQILAGKGLACFVSCTAVCTALMVVGVMVFKVHVSSVLLLASAIGSAAFCFVGIMMLISVLGKTEHTVGGAGWAILLVMSMLGGGMVPLMFMPSWIGTLSNISPMKWCVLAFEGAIWRGFAFSEMLLPLGVLWGIGLAGFAIGTAVLMRSER